MRVVLDTNVFVSAVLGGRLSGVLEAWDVGRFTLLVNADILREYREVLSRPKFGLTVEDVDNIIGYVFHRAEFVTAAHLLNVIVEDSPDNRFLEVGVAGQADCIVSGDRHLLRLQSCEGIPIISARDFLDRLGY